jgi:DNA repair photolyase
MVNYCMSSINTGIEWTDRTWNPTTGCDKVSPGCTHCYAEALTKRFHTNFPNGFDLTEYPKRLNEPKSWRKPSRIFVNSMSDLFHEDVSLEFLKQVFDVMRETPHHIYQILTKRDKRLVELAPQLEWSDNIWMGVSVENQNYVHRVDSFATSQCKGTLFILRTTFRAFATRSKRYSLGNSWGRIGDKNTVRCRKNGHKVFGISVRMLKSRFSSSNGEVEHLKLLGDCWMGKFGMRCPKHGRNTKGNSMTTV